MGRIIYSEGQIKALRANPNVVKCSAKSITYSADFKIKAVQTYYKEGLGPNAIFQKAGFDLTVIGPHRAENCLKDWRRIYKAKGEAGLMHEQRGLNARGRKSKGNQSDNEYLQAKVAYLEAENAFLKKLKTKTNT